MFFTASAEAALEIVKLTRWWENEKVLSAEDIGGSIVAF